MNEAQRFLRLPAVLEMTGRGRTATLDDVKAGTFPKPLKVGSASMWRQTDVQAWMAQKAAGAAWAPVGAVEPNAALDANPVRSSAMNAQRERIATHVLAALISRTAAGDLGAGVQGHEYAEVACDFADSLIAALARRKN